MAFTTLKTSQSVFLEKHLRGTGRELSSAQAAETYGIMNLRARICELKAMGLRIRKSVNTRGRTAYSISRRDVSGSQSKLLA